MAIYNNRFLPEKTIVGNGANKPTSKVCSEWLIHLDDMNLIPEVPLVCYNEGENKNVELGKPGYLLRLPYKSVYDFVNVLSKSGLDDSIKKSISRAVSLNEGCNNQDLDEKNLVLASTEIKDPYGKSFKLFPLEEFDLFVNKSEHLTKYIEYEADSLIFRHKKHKHISLTISLDLYEMLHFIQKGLKFKINIIL
jgi:hypothetical protein